jgi:hypothetical protein
MKTKDLDLKTLEWIQFCFKLHSDYSTQCLGYGSLCKLIEERKKINEGIVNEANPKFYKEGIYQPVVDNINPAPPDGGSGVPNVIKTVCEFCHSKGWDNDKPIYCKSCGDRL